jgi:hypothetical protein
MHSPSSSGPNSASPVNNRCGSISRAPIGQLGPIQLDSLARRDPQAVLAVLGYWLTPQHAEGSTRVEC